jgi:N-acetyl-beta-hexosaminidase
LLSRCSNNAISEPVNVTSDDLYDFVHSLYDEIVDVFPDEWIHLGGDEGMSVNMHVVMNVDVLIVFDFQHYARILL